MPGPKDIKKRAEAAKQKQQSKQSGSLVNMFNQSMSAMQIAGTNSATTTKSTDGKISTTTTKVVPPSKPKTVGDFRPKAEKTATNAKSYNMDMGSKQIDSPTTFNSKQAATLQKAPGFKNEAKAEKRATKMAHLRNKGTDAIKSGNQAKAKRLRERYDRQAKRLSKS